MLSTSLSIWREQARSGEPRQPSSHSCACVQQWPIDSGDDVGAGDRDIDVRLDSLAGLNDWRQVCFQPWRGQPKEIEADELKRRDGLGANPLDFRLIRCQYQPPA
ncbi:hypothetical protein [Sphingomonas sp. SORGH_AS_0438]|uniref:hypothetical protein n=1 Tax=Sphingomonas sp. SORGH_AS_0438 TaxID=3041756 RepID=UPI0028678DBF|nr:hypothetical protein [Sphingomonas sp. SORGH_AS_0438]MDR6126736.1 hypothetical protein [Sphingomonas sp. SORGH_AS_0438]